MKWIVEEDFTDLQDGRKIYRKGKGFPRPANKEVDPKRLEELATTQNRQGVPLIRKVEEKQRAYTNTDDTAEPITEKTKEKPKAKKTTKKASTKPKAKSKKEQG
ncbi:hypothetical protein [Rossellomorea marisflavi]|uniref:hypothetical protein n=1 Tax=Rossellomorea marisflavi TaxID=189381 RepID=UPI003457ECB4